MRYLDWLHAQINTKTGDPLAHSSIAHYFGELRQIFRAARALPGDRLPKVVLFPSCLVPNRAPPAPTLPLHANHIRTILDQCYYEIDETMHRFELGLQLLASPHPTQDQDPVLHQLVHAIAELTSSGSPSLEALSARGFHSSTIEEYGTLTVLRSYVAATVDSLTPFYVALLIQTSANPEPFRNILRNCVEPHPLEDNHRIVFWQKPRAGHQCKRIQGRSFDIRKKRAAPNLITAIREITRPLAPTIKSKDPVPLFLVRTNVTPRKQIVSYGSFIYSVIKFCNRANRRIEQWNQQNPDKPKEPIPKFTLRQLRFSTAAIQYEATGGDIRHVSRILNHRNVSTTISYVDSPRIQRLREKVIASSQTAFVDYVLGDSAVPMPCKHDSELEATPASASVAHICRDPFRPPGTSGGSARSRLCPHFHNCMSCPGLTIPLDAPHLARLLLFRDTLDAARDRLDPHRWLIFYEELSSSTDDILSQFPDEMHLEARALCRELPPLPELE